MGKSNRRQNEGQYAPLPYTLLKSPAWRSLSGAAMKVFLELHTRYNGGNNGRLHLSMNEASAALGIGKATAQRAFKELQDRGLLVLEHPGSWYSRRAHEWRLTTKPTVNSQGKIPATNDWRNWSAKTERGSDTDPSTRSLVPLRNPKPRSGPTSKPVMPDSGAHMGSGMERL